MCAVAGCEARKLSCLKSGSAIYNKVMRTNLLLGLFLILTVPLFAQKTVVVEKIGTSRRQLFSEGDFFRIKANCPDTLLEGTLCDISDSTVTVCGWRPVVVKIKDISRVYKKFRFPARFGKFLGVGGVTLFAIIMVNHLINNEQVFTQDMFIIAGSMIGAGLISISLSEKKYRMGDRWKIKIMDFNNP